MLGASVSVVAGSVAGSGHEHGPVVSLFLQRQVKVRYSNRRQFVRV